ncbi:MAG: lamin tail domain-containing protein, partial [Chloroflexi bacterium]|nr:lamin tail domain-containing protein [Chloroflexota bacterium]
PPSQPLRPPTAAPSFFVALTNGDFELPGETPYGWRAHAGDALVTFEGGSRAALLTSTGAATAWLHQSFAVEGGRWYEAAGRLRPGAGTDLARIRVAWYASGDASGPQLSVADSEDLEGGSDSFATVATGPIRAPAEALSAQLRIMLLPAAESPATLLADGVSFARTAPPPPATRDKPPEIAAPAPVEAPSFFASLTNGDFELPGDAPYGWRVHGGDAIAFSEGDSRAVVLTSRSGATMWLHQSFTVAGGRWYEAGGRLRLVSNVLLARLRIAWYASDDASGAQLSVADSDAIEGVGDSFAAVSTGAIRAPDEARSAQLRIMLRPAGEAPAVLHADDVSFVPTADPAPVPTPPALDATSASPSPDATAASAAAAAGTPPTAALEPYYLRSASAVLLRITELLPDPVQSGSDAEYEWIEVTNVGAAAVPLAGLILADNHGRIALPTLTLPPGAAIVIAGPRAEIGDAIALRQGSGLFNGLGNSGDRIVLATQDGAIIDALSYGSDDGVDQPPLKAPAAGRSLQRRFDPAGRLIEATVADQPSPGRIESPVPPGAVAVVEPDARPTATAAAPSSAERASPSSVESLRRQLDAAASADRTAWIVLASIAAVALVAAAAHRARELLRAAPPARGRPSRRPRRWRRYASGEQVSRRALSPRRPRRTPPA